MNENLDNNEKMLPPRPVSPVQSSSEDFTGFGGPPAMMPLSPIVEVSQECYRSVLIFNFI